MTRIEKDVLVLLLAGDDPVLSVLRKQLTGCMAEEREMTGVGFYTKLKVALNAPRLHETQDFKFGDVRADMTGLKHGAGFLLYVERGAIDTLEGYTYDERWPETAEALQVEYSGGRRDLDNLRKKWSERLEPGERQGVERERDPST